MPPTKRKITAVGQELADLQLSEPNQLFQDGSLDEEEGCKLFGRTCSILPSQTKQSGQVLPPLEGHKHSPSVPSVHHSKATEQNSVYDSYLSVNSGGYIGGAPLQELLPAVLETVEAELRVVNRWTETLQLVREQQIVGGSSPRRCACSTRRVHGANVSGLGTISVWHSYATDACRLPAAEDMATASCGDWVGDADNV